MFYQNLFQELDKEKVRYLVVGGIAVNLYGIPRMTADLDLLIDFSSDNVQKLLSVLKDQLFQSKLPVDPLELANPQSRTKWHQEKSMIAFAFYHTKTPYLTVDILIHHPLDFEKSYTNRLVTNVSNCPISLVSISDLIELKKYSGRKQDYSDIESLQTLLGQ